MFFTLLALGYTAAVSVRLVRRYLQRRRRTQRIKRRSERIASRDMTRLLKKTREKTKFIRSQEAHIKILNAMIDRAQTAGSESFLASAPQQSPSLKYCDAFIKM